MTTNSCCFLLYLDKVAMEEEIMIDAEETRRQKARNLRYKKPIVRDLNLDDITEERSNMVRKICI